MSRSRIFSIAILAAAIALSANRATAQSASSVTAAGGALLPNGATYAGVSLQDVKFGIGALIAGNGSATGDVLATLRGTAAKNKARTIIVEGKTVSGSGSAGGPGTLSGVSTVDLGDGTAPLASVPFALTLSRTPGGTWNLLMTIGNTSLPAATVNAGSITVR